MKIDYCNYKRAGILFHSRYLKLKYIQVELSYQFSDEIKKQKCILKKVSKLPDIYDLLYSEKIGKQENINKITMTFNYKNYIIKTVFIMNFVTNSFFSRGINLCSNAILAMNYKLKFFSNNFTYSTIDDFRQNNAKYLYLKFLDEEYDCSTQDINDDCLKQKYVQFLNKGGEIEEYIEITI